MKLAFLILAHRYPEQVIKLTRALLSEEGISVFIHVDGKSDEVYEILKKEFQGNPNVIFTPYRYKVYWGSYNQIRATVLLMKTAKQHGAFDYYSLISGQDFPLKPLREFKEYLKLNKGKEFMIHFKLPDSGNWGGNGGLDRMQYFWIDVKIQKYSYSFGKLNGLIHRIQNLLGYKRKLTYDLYGGFNWFTLSHDAISYILTFLDKNRSYIKRYRYTRCADEIFVQTILMNSHFKERVVNGDMRFINWQTGPEYPKILRMEDYDLLTKKENVFLGRKFDNVVDGKVIDELITFVTRK